MIQWFSMLAGWMVADVLWWRAADRRLRPVKGAKVWRWLLGLFMGAQVAFMLMMVVGSILEHVPQRGPLLWPVAAYVWHLFVLPAAVMAMLFARGVRWMRDLRAKVPVEAPAIQELEQKPRLTRREALAAVGVTIPPLITMGVGVGAVEKLGGFRVRDVELKLPGLPADLDGVTIAHVSDLHIGRFLPAGVMERVAEATNAMRADLVVFTGDLIDVSCETVPPGIDFIKRLDRRNGLVVIEGNHDGMGGADRFEGEMRDAGLPLLLDESAVFTVPGRQTPLQMMGIAWGELKRGSEIGRVGREARRWYRETTKEATDASIARVAAQRQAGAYPILLAHHPHAFDRAAAAGLPLVLSGHTHGGQMMLTKNIGVGPMRFRYWSGIYEKPGSRLFVNNGVGNWFPLRINAPAEVVKLTLRA
ncbi:MAG: putative hydrolase [Phycisphaerales bacterium]|nr:putative hydrolase [Phycisphaerales bacterium]